MSHPPAPRPLDPVGLLWALGAAGLWATMSIAGRWLLQYECGPLPLMALRATLAAAALGLVLLLTRPGDLRLPWREVPFFALYGLVSVAGNYLTYFLALQQVGATLAVTAFYTYPAIAALLAAVFLGERLNWYKALPLPITFFGCALMAGLLSPGDPVPRPAGIAWAVLSAATFALYPIFGRRALSRHAPWTALFYSIAFAAAFLLLLWAGLCPLLPALAESCGRLPNLAPGNLPFWGGVLYLALGPTLGAYLAYLLALRRLEVRQASLVTTLEPVVAVILAVLLLGERLIPAQWAGAALILSAVLWLRLERILAAGRTGERPPARR